MMWSVRKCAQLSFVGALVPLSVAARAATATCPAARSPPFSIASIRFSNPLFQSPFRSKVEAAAEPKDAGACNNADPAAGASQQDSSVVAVYVTVPDLEQGKQIAHHLVKEKLAACCNIIPGVTSVYVWEGEVEEDPELLLMIKTTQYRLPALTKAVQQMHSYDECEVVAVPVVGGSETYLQWVGGSVRETAPKKPCCKGK